MPSPTPNTTDNTSKPYEPSEIEKQVAVYLTLGDKATLADVRNLTKWFSDYFAQHETKLLQGLLKEQLIYYQHVYNISSVSKTELAVPVEVIEAAIESLLEKIKGEMK